MFLRKNFLAGSTLCILELFASTDKRGIFKLLLREDEVIPDLLICVSMLWGVSENQQGAKQDIMQSLTDDPLLAAYQLFYY